MNEISPACDSLPPRLRLFVAIPIPGPVRAAVARAQDALRVQTRRAEIQWTRAGQWHITLKFLGAVESSRLTDLGAAIEGAARPFSTFDLTVAGLGFFPPRGAPRVIWAGVRDASGTLKLLHEAMERATAPFTAETPEGRFTGHITLGRVKAIGPAECEALPSAARQAAEGLSGGWTVNGVELIRSELSSQGSRYTTLFHAKLG